MTQAKNNGARLQQKKRQEQYRTCKKSKNKREVVTANNRIMNAIEVIFFPYDNLDGKSWYFKTDEGYEISIKAFNQLIARNKAIKTELRRIKRQLRLMQKNPDRTSKSYPRLHLRQCGICLRG